MAAKINRGKRGKAFSRFPFYLIMGGLFLLSCGSRGTSTPGFSATGEKTAPPSPVVIRWLIGTGKGALPVEMEAERRVVERFNANHAFQLKMEIVEGGVIEKVLREEIASGSGPDIIGPMDLRIASEWGDVWMDLSPWIERKGFDLSQFIRGSADFLQIHGAGRISLPFAVDPSFLYFNKRLFDEEGMNYPPAGYGEKYLWKNADGPLVEMDWNVDTLRKLALRLTKDIGGKHPYENGFLPDKIVQFGFASQLSDLREQATMFGTGSFVAQDGKTARIPESWRAAFQWYYDGLWEEHFLPNAAYLNSDALNLGDPFNSNHVAMAQARLQYTCCLEEHLAWDLAPLPYYHDRTTAVMQASSFYILSSTRHPEEAWEVLTYLVEEAAPNLLSVYGQFPARRDIQPDFLSPIKAKYPSVRNWDIVSESIARSDVPSCMLALPNNRLSEERIADFQSQLQSVPDLDLDFALEELENDLGAIFRAIP